MERYVVLGLARARAEWFRVIGQWATAAALPAEFVRCVSLDELRARLRSGRSFSAVVLDGALPGVDRDLIALAARASVAVLVVDDERRGAWRELGADAVLATRFSRDELLEVLASTSRPVGTATFEVESPQIGREATRGALVTVTGPGGTGASSVAAALAQGLATTDRRRTPASAAADGLNAGSLGRRRVLLADLCRTADQAMLHDARLLVPGIQELVEAHRSARPDPGVVFDHTFDVPVRGYRLLLGLRRPRHWVALRPHAFTSAVDALERTFDVVVADTELDLEGEHETGSADVEDRNLMARTAIARSSIVLVVGEPSMKGVFSLARSIAELHAFGVGIERILPVVNRVSRWPRRRAELTRSVHDLAVASIAAAGDLVAPIHLPERPVDAAFRDGVALATGMSAPLAGAVTAMVKRLGALAVPEAGGAGIGVPVAPGSLAGWAPGEGEA